MNARRTIAPLVFLAICLCFLAMILQKDCKITYYRERTDNEIIHCQQSCKYECSSCFDKIGVCE